VKSRTSVIGPCPACKTTTDEIVQSETRPNVLVCGACRSAWDERHFMVSAVAALPGAEWRIVKIRVNGLSVSAECFSGQPVPFSSQIQRTLNAALITRFKLRVSFGAEGGVEGKLKMRKPNLYVRLNNFPGLFGGAVGLMDEFDGHPNPASSKVLKWAYDFLGILFCEYIGGTKGHVKGAVLFLDEKDSEEKNELDFLLHRALDCKGGRGFAKKVADTMRKFSKVEERHITGLSDKSIKEVFVVPPIS
jgi:hypothetical protein